MANQTDGTVLQITGGCDMLEAALNDNKGQVVCKP